MRIRWRGLELPGRVLRDDAVSTDVYGRFVVEAFEQGFGTTIGNSIRRVLLSSLEGAAVTSIKIDGVLHEFSSIDKVLEDVTDIVLNVKGIVVRFDNEGVSTMSLERDKAGEVRAGELVTEPWVTVVNPDHLIATLTEDTSFKVEMSVASGRGYATAAENRSPEQEVGVIPIDSVFSPVIRVRYRTEDMRVGQRTNYDRLILEVWTKGTILPEDALVEAGIILRKHVNPFVMYHEMGDLTTSAPPATVEGEAQTDDALEALLDKPVSVLSLSVRAGNCLEAARLTTLRDLVTRTEADLLRVRSFGKTSLDEVEIKLKEYGLSLGLTEGADDAESDAADAPDGAVAADPMLAGSSEAPSESPEDSSSTEGSGPMEVFTMGD